MPATTRPTYAVLDLETTGLRPDRSDRVVEIAIVRTDAAGTALDEWSTLVNPEGRRGAEQVHGLTPGELRDAPRFADIAPAIAARLEGCTIVAHHATFDIGFLEAEYLRTGAFVPSLEAICTVRAAREAGLPRPWSLDVLTRRLGIHKPGEESHRALNDAHATARLWRLLLRQGARPEQLIRAQRQLEIDWTQSA